MTHPLQPLSDQEMRSAVAIVRADPDLPRTLLFETVELDEPPKSEVRAHRPGDPVRRRARLVVFPAGSVGAWQVVADLDGQRVLSKTHFPDARPMIQPEQLPEIEDLVRSHPEFIAACERRGIADMARVVCDPWSAGRFGIEGEGDSCRHLTHVFCWVRPEGGENYYAHPLEGLNAVVDIRKLEVLRVDDHGVVPVPEELHEYAAAAHTPRNDLRPIDIAQPDGVSFSLDGHHLAWHDWTVLIGFNSREALTLHDVRYRDRPVLYRGSIAEMVVPYGSPERGHFRKNVFDIGEYGAGKLANSLERGCDCLGAIRYLDAWVTDIHGDILHIGNAICIHEEDAGILWKHRDMRSGRAEVRRARRLVISCIVTVGNYEYGYYWYLHLDGTIEFEMKATGIINTTACVPGEPQRYGREVAPGIVGQLHQHLFCARLDMAVDGDANTVVECNTTIEAPENNPWGNAYFEEESVLASERAAARRANAASQRYWKVINPNRKNRVGMPSGYRLEPANCVTPFVLPDSPSGRRSAFTRNHLWVTAHEAGERFPAGDFVNQSDGSDSIAEWILRDRPLVNTDLVLWHVFGLHHQPRPEDFPVQPCAPCGFRLMPSGFFDSNPCLDLPA